MLAEHLEKLRYFSKMASYQSINEAAQALNVSQAGLSKSIAALESVLDVRLLARSNRGFVLTKEGESVLAAANDILRRAESLEHNLRSLKASSAPRLLRIGLYDSIAVYYYDQLQQYLSEVYPGTQMQLVVDSTLDLVKTLSAENIDLMIGVNVEAYAVNGAKMFHMFEDSYSFYASTKIDTKTTAPLLIHPRSSDQNGVGVLEHLKSLIEKNGAHFVYNFETLKTLTMQGLGIGVLPTQVAKPLVEQRLLEAIKLTRIKSQFGFHNIGMLVGRKTIESHSEFALDLYRLGVRWSKFG